MSLLLEDNGMCWICGKENADGLRLDFDQPEKGRLRSSVTFTKKHQGFKNIVHGGLVAAVLDEMMVNLAWKEGIPAVTAQIQVRLKKPIEVGQKVHLKGWIEAQKGRILYAGASASNEKDEMLASASAICIRIRKSR